MRTPSRRLLTGLTAAAALTLSACADSDPEASATSVTSADTSLSVLVADTNSGDEAVSTTAAQPSKAESDETNPPDEVSEQPGQIADVSPVSELEEAPAIEPETLTEKLEATNFVEEVATDLEVQAVEQPKCDGLAETIVATNQKLLLTLGEASRDDDRLVDDAFEQFGLNGALISQKAEELGCGESELKDYVCRSIDQLTPQGDVGSDLVDIISDGCS